MARVIKTPENETQCKTCKCRIEYFHEDIYEYQNSFIPSMIFQYIKCPACVVKFVLGTDLTDHLSEKINMVWLIKERMNKKW